MRRSTMIAGALTLAAAVALTTASFAQPMAPRGQGPGTGPVVAACQTEIEQKCSGKEHANRDIRTCLEANRASLSKACQDALDSTGGRGMNRRN